MTYAIGIIVSLLLLPVSVLASSITLGSSQTNLNWDEELRVNVSLSISNDTHYFLRGVFYHSDGSYCGYTWNGSSWFSGPISNDGFKNFLDVQVQSSTWSGELKSKIDISDSDCRTSGQYTFKVQRYTEGGSASFDEQNVLALTITVPTPTHTQAPTQAPSHTPAPTSPPRSTPTTAVVIPTSTRPIAEKTPSLKPFSSPTDEPDVSPEPTDTPIASALVLGSQVEASSSSNRLKPAIISLSFVGAGLGILSVALFVKKANDKTT